MAEARRWWSPELRATLYYSTVFMTSGATAAYGGIVEAVLDAQRTIAAGNGADIRRDAA